MDHLSTCNCCSGVNENTPLVIDNQPGLTSIAYRIGKFPDFKNSLLAKLTSKQIESLQKLTTRSDDDFSISILDSFSVMADVLTFYQERLANEAYLNTATELFSITELARLIGYELNPGVAATTFLSFTLEDKSLKPGSDALRKVKSVDKESPVIKIPIGTQSQSIPEVDEIPQIFETVEEIHAKSDWNSIQVKSFVDQTNIPNKSIVYIEGLENNIKKGDQILLIEGEDIQMKKVTKVELLKDINSTALYFSNTFMTTNYVATSVAISLHNYYTSPYSLSSKTISNIVGGFSNASAVQSVLRIQNWNKHEFRKTINNYKAPTSNQPKIYVFRNSAALFGYNAPPKKPVFNFLSNVMYNDHSVSNTETPNIITLDAEYPNITADEDSYIALKRGSGSFQYYRVNSAELLPQSKYGISAKSTKLGVSGLSWSTGFNQIRNSKAYIQSERLSLAQKPITDHIEAGSTEIPLSQYYIDLEAGQRVLISGELVDLPGIIRAEIHTIKEVPQVENVTHIILEKAIENSFVRNTITINANVALATHGETVNEVLGNGDSRIPFQKFTLKQTPITYVSDDSDSGSSSTVKITVNDITWTEVPFLYGEAKDARVFTISNDSENNTVITFGDGKHGSRLPTGKLNVRATYRKGIGSEGLLQANQISQLISKPHYLKTVNNPLAPEGAQDAEKIEAARKNANLTIRTLDRIVSLQDYEDFARAFAGIEKAKAIWLWSENGKIVHLTVAGANGNAIAENSELRKNLISALHKASHPGVHLKIDSYKRSFFKIIGSLKVIENYNFQKVHDEVVTLLRSNYSFDNRSIGENIFLSKIIADIESIEGVEFVDIDQLYIIGSQAKLNSHIIANLFNSNATQFGSSELLELDPSPLHFNQMT